MVRRRYHHLRSNPSAAEFFLGLHIRYRRQPCIIHVQTPLDQVYYQPNLLPTHPTPRIDEPYVIEYQHLLHSATIRDREWRGRRVVDLLLLF